MGFRNSKGRRVKIGESGYRGCELKLSIQATSPWIGNKPKGSISEPADQPRISRNLIGRGNGKVMQGELVEQPFSAGLEHCR